MSEILGKIAANVRHYRLKKGLTQARLAKMTKHHRNYISSIENARVNIYLTTLYRFARALGVKPRDLVK